MWCHLYQYVWEEHLAFFWELNGYDRRVLQISLLHKVLFEIYFFYLLINPTEVILVITESPTTLIFNFDEEVSGDTPQSGLIFGTSLSLSYLCYRFLINFPLYSCSIGCYYWLFFVRKFSSMLVEITYLIMSLLGVDSPLTFFAHFRYRWFLLAEL